MVTERQIRKTIIDSLVTRLRRTVSNNPTITSKLLSPVDANKYPRYIGIVQEPVTKVMQDSTYSQYVMPVSLLLCTQSRTDLVKMIADVKLCMNSNDSTSFNSQVLAVRYAQLDPVVDLQNTSSKLSRVVLEVRYIA